MTTKSAYRSEKARATALASYDTILANWPVPYETQIIPTSFGETHIIISGHRKFKPLVLLHGAGGNSAMWIYNIAPFSQHFRVYAIDIIGEAGKSAGTRPLLTSDGHSRWLKEVFDALGLHKAALCGASLGGTIAHRFAALFPQHVSSLALLAPPSLLKMKTSFLFRAILVSLLPTPLVIKNFLTYISSRATKLPASAVHAFIAQIQAYKPYINTIPIISNHELTQLPARTVVFLGSDEVMYNINKVAIRIHCAAPSIKGVIVPDAKHTISVDQPDFMNDMLIKFLKE